jgi:hypothetical protein
MGWCCLETGAVQCLPWNQHMCPPPLPACGSLLHSTAAAKRGRQLCWVRPFAGRLNALPGLPARLPTTCLPCRSFDQTAGGCSLTVREVYTLSAAPGVISGTWG